VGAPESMCELPLGIWVDDESIPSYTTFLRACAYAATLDTKILAPGLRVHVSSDYTGRPDGSTRSTHLVDGRGTLAGHSDWSAVEHARVEIDVRWEPRGCLYDHLHRVLDLIGRIGHVGRIEVGDNILRPFDALARRSPVDPRLVPLGRRIDVAAILRAWGLGSSC
jgi:hypothetical protein